jgi:hypothetical protein
MCRDEFDHGGTVCGALFETIPGMAEAVEETARAAAHSGSRGRLCAGPTL